MNDEDVVVALVEIGVAHVGAGRQIFAAPEPVDHDLRRMCTIELGVVQRVHVTCVDQVRILLGAPKNELPVKISLSMKSI